MLRKLTNAGKVLNIYQRFYKCKIFTNITYNYSYRNFNTVNMNVNNFEIFKMNSYHEFVNNGKTFLINREPYLDIVLTDYCNANCSFCIADLIHDKLKLDLEKFKEKVKFAVDNMGVKECLLLGGEPTMSTLLLPAIEYLKTLNLNKIIMTTNGIRLAN